MNITLQITVDINRLKKNLIDKAKKRGLYENFGQREVGQLREKYIDYESFSKDDGQVWSLISKFNNWCMNFNDSDLRGS